MVKIKCFQILKYTQEYYAYNISHQIIIHMKSIYGKTKGYYNSIAGITHIQKIGNSLDVYAIMQQLVLSSIGSLSRPAIPCQL